MKLIDPALLGKILAKIWVPVILVLLFIATSWSVFVPGMFRVHDYVHGARIAEIVRGAEAGHLPVRWSEHFGYGYGMPLFIFYAPLPYYAGAVVYWFTNNLIWGVKSLFIIVNAGTILGGYFLGKRISGNRVGGIVGAAVLGLAPYRALNVFVRGAISEAWGIMFITWLWYGLYGLLNQPVIDSNLQKLKKAALKDIPTDWFIVVLASVGVMLSHNLTTFMTFPVTGGIIVLWSIWKIWTRVSIQAVLQRAVQSISALLLAGGLASFYLIPMYIEKSFIRTDIFLGGYFDFRLHFLYIRQFFNTTWDYGGSAWGPEDDISFFLGWPIFLAAALAVLFCLLLIVKQVRGWISKKKTKQFLLVDFTLRNSILMGWLVMFGLVTVSALFLTLLKSLSIWEFLPLIENLQFPWRWLSIATVAMTILVVIIYSLIDQNLYESFSQLSNRARNSVIRSIATVFVLVSLLHIPYFTPELWLDEPSTLYYEDALRIQTRMSDIMLDYIPSTLKMVGTVANKADETEENGLQPFNSLDSVFNADDFPKIETLVDRPHQKLVTVQADSNTELIWPIANFPGWKVYVDGKEASTQVSEHGLLSVNVPAGSHTVGALFSNTPIRVFADILSGIALMLLFGAVIKNAYPRKQKA